MMVSTKALAAIGITMCLVIPIGLGYVLSIEEEPVTSWQTTNQSNISSLLLNNQAPYFGSYKGSTNNSALLGDSTAAPEYISVTSNYSSLPIYTETSVEVTPAVSWTTYNYIEPVGSDQHWFAPTYRAGIPGTGHMIGTHDLYTVKSPVITYTVDNTDDYLLALGEEVVIYRDSASTWTMEYADGSGTPITDISWWMGGTINQDVGGTIIHMDASYKYADYVDADDFAPASMTAIGAAMKHGNNYSYGDYNIRVTTGDDIINGQTTDQSISIASVDLINAITTTASGTFADPADGWTVPSPSGTYSWVNNQYNDSVTFYVNMNHGAGQYCTIGDLRIASAAPNSVSIYLVSEGQSTAQNLGAYDYIQVVADSDGYTVSGLAAWPTMGTVATTYNTITLDKAGAPFYYITLQATSQDFHFRVDNANVLQGYYPDTYNYTLDLAQLYPSTSIDLYVNSVGVYGDEIGIAGTNYPVDLSTGSITIGDNVYRLLHAHISAWQTDGGYSVRINGVEVAETVALPEIYFGGEWSLTVTAYKMESVEDMALSWHAGEWNLDKDSFAAAVVVTAVLMIIVLGMTGGRSMSKMGLLLLVCGGAALTALIMI